MVLWLSDKSIGPLSKKHKNFSHLRTFTTPSPKQHKKGIIKKKIFTLLWIDARKIHIYLKSVRWINYNDNLIKLPKSLGVIFFWLFLEGTKKHVVEKVFFIFFILFLFNIFGLWRRQNFLKRFLFFVNDITSLGCKLYVLISKTSIL